MGLDDVLAEIVNRPIVMSAMLGYLKPGAYHQALCKKLASRLSYKEFVDIWNGLLSANEDMTALVEWLKPIRRLVLGNFESFFLSYYEMGLVKLDAAFSRHILDSLDVQATDCVSSTTEPKM